ncbi:MAG: hypothetical protein PQJ46_02920, partial [Spirochaetales bacterium]|nr:hypothetical protein [Spirochaetales bacterium]
MKNHLVQAIFIIFTLSFLPLFAEGSCEQEKSIIKVWDFKFNDIQTRRVFTKIDNLFLENTPEALVEHTGFEEEEYIPALRSALLAGTAPDIIMLHQGLEFTEFQSYLEPLDSFIQESEIKFNNNSLEPCTNISGEKKALPLSFQGIGWYYNK